ncbi:hypothetical protein HA402_014170 [Bradysia odoriphaga]|nr:hypothetical protein HA402_014170 [Bradysia odoriphaga]
MEPNDRKSNWFKSLTRRKKSSNKENNQSVNIDTSVSAIPSESTESALNRQSATNSNSQTSNSTKSTNVLSWVTMFRKRALQRRRDFDADLITASDNRLMNLERRAVANDYVLGLPNLDIPPDQMVNAMTNQIESPWLIQESSPNMEHLIMLNAQVLMNNHGWYRGGISRTNAQKKLQGQPDGSFLLRNSQTSGTHFTLSFRSAGITLHYRIQYENGYWSIESSKYISVVEMIEDAMRKSKNQIFCYVKPGAQNILQPPFPVRLTNPISKFDEVPKLQHICRYYIRTSRVPISLDTLPKKLQEYVKQNKYLNIHYGFFEDIS